MPANSQGCLRIGLFIVFAQAEENFFKQHGGAHGGAFVNLELEKFLFYLPLYIKERFSCQCEILQAV